MATTDRHSSNIKNPGNIKIVLLPAACIRLYCSVRM